MVMVPSTGERIDGAPGGQTANPVKSATPSGPTLGSFVMMARREWVVNVERGEKWNGRDSHMSKPFPHGCLYSFHSPRTMVACDRVKWM